MEDYKDEKVLKERNKGQAGRILKVKCTKNNKSYIRKEYVINDENPLERVQEEANNMKLFNYKFINGFVDGFPGKDKKTYNLILELCKSGSLRDMLDDVKKDGKTLTIDDALKYFLMIGLGIGYIHRNNMFHRELTPDNIFLAKDKTIRVGDLGCAIKFDKDNPTSEYIGTSNTYTAPEALSYMDYGPKVDTYSLGIVLYELFTCVHPFDDPNDPMGFYQNIMNSQYTPIGEVRPDTPQEIQDLLPKMLEYEADERPEILDILKENQFLKDKAVQYGLAYDMSLIIGEQLGNVKAGEDEIDRVYKYLTETCGIDKNYFDPEFNNMDGGWAKSEENVGGLEYFPPYGWYGLGLNIEKLYPDIDDFTWCRWFFPVIDTADSLKIIDEYLIEYIRYLSSGRHYKGNYRITYEHIKELGFRSLVNEYYRYKEEKHVS